MQGRFFLDVVVRERATVFELLAGKNQTLLIRGNGLFVLIFVFMSYILPKFMKIFEGMKVSLPLSTQILQGLSDFFAAWWWLVLVGIAIIITLMRWYFSTPTGRERLHGWLLEAPLVKKIVRPTMFGQFARTLGALLRNGVPVLTALKITESVVQNVVLQEAIEICFYTIQPIRGR